MFRENREHLQWPLFSSIDALPPKLQVRLEESWASTFYHEFFCRIDERAFAVLYATVDSRPNVPVNVLVGLETLKAGFGWSDQEAYEHFCYDIQVRYALGYRDLGSGHFELRTLYNFRARLTQYMQETGENPLEQAFREVTDAQLAAFNLRTDKLRMDSTFVASNIRETTRLQLLVEVLLRTERMLDETDRERYQADFAPYTAGSSGQYVYRLKRPDYAEHLQRIGELMQRLLQELAPKYAAEPTYQILARVFAEHYHVVEGDAQAKASAELSTASLQSPDDMEATYRRKRGQGHRGYITNITETCNPANDFQLIVAVQTEANNTDDAVMLETVLPELAERTAVTELYTDGGYNGPDADQALQDQKVVLVQSSIRGRSPSEEKLGLEDFQWETDPESGLAVAVTCPHQQHAVVTAGRKAGRYRAAFDAEVCAGCPHREQCPTHCLTSRPERALRFSTQDVNVALRRQRSIDERNSGHHLRPAVEATVRGIKNPFRHGKVPVRGNPRVSMLMLGSALMYNVRQIHRYQRSQEADPGIEKGNEVPQKSPVLQLGFAFFYALQSKLSNILSSVQFRPSAWASA